MPTHTKRCLKELKETGKFQDIAIKGSEDLQDKIPESLTNVMSKISTEISNGLKHRFSCFIGDTDSVEKSDQQKAARAVKCPIKCFTPELFPENLPGVRCPAKILLFD